jgi:hypothetical protein
MTGGCGTTQLLALCTLKLHKSHVMSFNAVCVQAACHCLWVPCAQIHVFRAQPAGAVHHWLPCRLLQLPRFKQAGVEKVDVIGGAWSNGASSASTHMELSSTVLARSPTQLEACFQGATDRLCNHCPQPSVFLLVTHLFTQTVPSLPLTGRAMLLHSLSWQSRCQRWRHR